MNTARFFAGALALLLCAAPSFAQNGPADVQGLMDEAFEHMTAANKLLADPATKARGIAGYEKACELYSEAEEGLRDLGLSDDQQDSILQIIHYNTACARSLQGRTPEAIAALELATEAGWADLEHMAKDSDLDPIRETPEYKALLVKTAEIADRRATDEAREALGAPSPFAYDFTVKTTDGKQLALADLRGKVVIVNFWGTWSPLSQKEIPGLVTLKKEFGDRLVIVGMAWEHGAGDPGTIGKVKAFADQNKMGYPLTLVTDKEDLRKVPEFRTIPTTLFIDKGGNVRLMAESAVDVRSLRALVTALDTEEGVAAPKKRPASAPTGDDWF
jgi:thiol-disulfide isomerase/thioredoxin